MGATSSKRIAAVRAFTRFYTGVIGLLEEGLLRTPYSMTEARLIFELAQRDVVDAVELRRQLGLDPGYLSRIVGRFEADGLLTRRRSTQDGRRQVLELTEHGRQVYQTLNERSAEQIAQLLEPVSEADQERLVAAMATIQEIVGAETPVPRTIVLRAPRAGDYGWVVSRHGALYATEYGWDAGFEALVARIVADYAEGHDPSREAAWIAELDGEPAGCVFCVTKSDTEAQLRILLVEPSARGYGIGARLVDECVRFAQGAGYESITLWTNDVLTSARRIYEAAGFELVEEEAHHSFGHDLVGQYWSRSLAV